MVYRLKKILNSENSYVGLFYLINDWKLCNILKNQPSIYSKLWNMAVILIYIEIWLLYWYTLNTLRLSLYLTICLSYCIGKLFPFIWNVNCPLNVIHIIFHNIVWIFVCYMFYMPLPVSQKGTISIPSVCSLEIFQTIIYIR
jgi:hypothetical protein